MTTERELQERQWRKNKNSRPRPNYTRKSSPRRKPRRNSFQDRLIIIISIVLVLLLCKHAPNIADLAKNTEIQKLIPSSVPSATKIDSPRKTKPKFVQAGNNESLQSYDYGSIDGIAASLNYQGTSVRELANQLKAYSKTDLEKARLIYSWIAHHISYDYSGFISGNYGDVTPEGVLRSRQGVCSGYANLFQALANEIGLESEVIEGYAKGISYAVGDQAQINHAWNGVKINNNWYLVDSTWGAGYINNNQFVKQFNPFYFATNPSQFIYSHLPVDEAWQLLSQPYSKQQFEELPKIFPAFFKYGLKVSQQTHTIQANQTAEILLDVPDNIVIAATLSANHSSVAENYTLIQKGQNQTSVSVTFPAPGAYELNIYAKPKDQTGQYDQAITYQLIADQTGQPFPKTYNTFSDNKAYLETPLVKILPAHQSVDFKLIVPQAQEVQVISQGGAKWTPLSNLGNSFQGTVPLDPGQIIVVAKFPNQSSYQYLVEYEGQ